MFESLDKWKNYVFHQHRRHHLKFNHKYCVVTNKMLVISIFYPKLVPYFPHTLFENEQKLKVNQFTIFFRVRPIYWFIDQPISTFALNANVITKTPNTIRVCLYEANCWWYSKQNKNKKNQVSIHWTKISINSFKNHINSRV